MKNPSFSLKHCFIGAALLASGAAHAVYLPAPTDTVNGVPVAHRYDDGYSYSTQVLDYLYPGSTYTSGAGTGQLDLLITTHNNSGHNPTGFDSPVYNSDPNASTFGGSWSTTVGKLSTYLQEKFQSTVPIFTFDQAETGSNPDISVAAKVEILSATGTGTRSWSFDALNNSIYNPESPATSPGEICISGVTKCFDNNTGGGHFDFLVRANGLDLRDFSNTPDAIFKITWLFSNADGGGEEITLTGLENRQQVPEPGILALVGLGIFGMAALRRRQKA